MNIFVSVAGLAALSQACDFPISTSAYSIVEAPHEPDSAAVELLLDAFADGEQCRAALREECADDLELCANTSGCSELTRCMRDQANPTAETVCGERHGSLPEAHWRYETLRRCWTGRYTGCSVGHDFRCVGAYSATTVERSELLLSQEILPLGSTPTTGLSVRVCDVLTDCEEPLAETRLDHTGRYTLSIPMLGRPGIAWDGYRLALGDGFPRMRIETNNPVWGRRFDVVQVFDSEQLVNLAKWRGVKDQEAMFVQILDCQSDPAPQIALSLVSTATDTPAAGSIASIEPQFIEGRLVTTSSGALAVHDLDPEADPGLKIVARRITADNPSGEVVASWQGSPPDGAITYLKMYPGPK